ncbi:MAG: TIGR02281 family clan AA aspartic protease [Gammaproteobacteria bacterium]|nr:TIGR02281 family clan AA aspartic protease [Gammaproteobacteria bacterium]
MSDEQRQNGTDPVQRMGQGMLWIFWLLVLGAGTWLFSTWSDSRDRAERTPEARVTDDSVEVRLRRGRNGHYLADGLIEGRPVTFLLDTGATSVVVPADQAARIGLERGPRIPIRTASGRDHAWLTRIDRLELGPLVLYDVDGAIAPGLQDHVLLGMSALGRLEMTQRDGELVLIQHR